MKAFLVNESNEATAIFDWDGRQQPIHLKIFSAPDEDISKLETIRKFFREQKDVLTSDKIAKMKEYRANEDLKPLKDMILKYLGLNMCCVSAIDELLATL